MSVLAKFVYEVKPGRFSDFMEKLAQAASPRFNSAVMPTAVRVYRSMVPGPTSGSVQLFIEYTDMAAYGARTVFEIANPEWQALFHETADAPQRLISVELLSAVPVHGAA